MLYRGVPVTLIQPLGPLPTGREAKMLDVILVFCLARIELETHFTELSSRLDSDGSLWVGWPK